jgi:hypothetical protein
MRCSTGCRTARAARRRPLHSWTTPTDTTSPAVSGPSPSKTTSTSDTRHVPRLHFAVSVILLSPTCISELQGCEGDAGGDEENKATQDRYRRCVQPPAQGSHDHCGREVRDPRARAGVRYRYDGLRQHPHVLHRRQHLSEVLALHDDGCQDRAARANRGLRLPEHRLDLLRPKRCPLLGMRPVCQSALQRREVHQLACFVSSHHYLSDPVAVLFVSTSELPWWNIYLWRLGPTRTQTRRCGRSSRSRGTRTSASLTSCWSLTLKS